MIFVTFLKHLSQAQKNILNEICWHLTFTFTAITY